MRRILLVTIALACASAMEAEARENRGDRVVTGRSAQVAKPAQGRVALVRGDVRTSRGGVVVRGTSAASISREPAAGACTRRGANRCGTQAVSRRGSSGVAGWQSGLPVASHTQRECPDGTFATLARGHEDVVRCMPM